MGVWPQRCVERVDGVGLTNQLGVVRCTDHRRSSGCVREQVDHPLRVSSIKLCGRFVEQNQRGVDDETPGHAESLAFTARQLVGDAILQVSQPKIFSNASRGGDWVPVAEFGW